MSESFPSVTVIIPSRPDLADVPAVVAARALDYPQDKLEIILARGRQPSVQRNAALRAAKGELIYFLDDDSLALPGNVRRAVELFRDPKVQMIGGPNLCPEDAPFLEQVFALVLSSWIAFGPSRARYTKVGAVRATSEKELILCNMLARRETVLRHGGFNEALYPNEENALMDNIEREGGKLLYDPELFVWRRPRQTVKAFVKMLLNYGRGRAEQFRTTPTLGSALNFVPPLFCVYLVALPVFLLCCQFVSLLPLAAYLLVLLLQVVALLPNGGIVRAACALPFIFLTHVFYGVGFWRGLFTRLRRPGERGDFPVTLETFGREINPKSR